MRSTTLTTRTLTSGRWVRINDTAANVSIVGTSPQQAITTSGSLFLSLLAHSQIPIPAVQWVIASSISSHCGADCFPCLLYTSDAADERSSVDLGGRRII